MAARNHLPWWASDPDKVALWEAMSALSGSAEAWYQDLRPFYELDLRDVVAAIHRRR